MPKHGSISFLLLLCCVLYLVTQSRPTLCALWTVACQVPLSMGILQARITERVAMPFRRSSQPRYRTQISWISGDTLSSEHSGKSKNTGMGSLSHLQGIFLTWIEPWSPSLQVDSLPAKLSVKPNFSTFRIYLFLITQWKSTRNIHWKDWWWRWSSNSFCTLLTLPKLQRGASHPQVQS